MTLAARGAWRLLVAGIALTCAVPAAARGQITSGITMNSEVLFPPLTANGVRSLQFGLITPGTTTVTVNPRTVQGGEWRLSGTRSRKSLDITFTLPTVLTNARGQTIPIDFNGTFAAVCEIDGTGACVLASYFEYNPVTTPTFRDTPQRYKPGRPTYSFDDYAVYVGGRIAPTASQPAGQYSANVTILLVIN